MSRSSVLDDTLSERKRQYRKLYSSRGAVEREFGRLKHEWALLPLRVRGLDRVRLHADLTILAKLACALARARGVPLAVGAESVAASEHEHDHHDGDDYDERGNGDCAGVHGQDPTPFR